MNHIVFILKTGAYFLLQEEKVVTVGLAVVI